MTAMTSVQTATKDQTAVNLRTRVMCLQANGAMAAFCLQGSITSCLLRVTVRQPHLLLDYSS